MVCKTVEEFIDSFVNKRMDFSELSFEDESMYELLVDYCKEKNDDELWNLVGVVYYDRWKDYKKAIEYFRKSAEHGNYVAQNYLGIMYQNGEGVNQDYEIAVSWYTKAAEQGNYFAQYNLGNMLFYGKGVKQDIKKAEKLFRASAKQGFYMGQYNLGYLLYSRGEYKKAIKWFKKSANQEYAEACNYIGIMYENGEGVETNYQEAIKWFEKGIKLGSAYSYHNLGYMYYDGIYYDVDYSKSKLYFEEALKVDSSLSESLYCLANLYYYGNFIDKNLYKALELFEGAEKNGLKCEFMINQIKHELHLFNSKNYCLEYAQEYGLVHFEYLVNKVKEQFDNNWRKLNKETIEFVEKGLKLYDFCVDIKDDGDYSPIVIEITKAIENEIKTKILDDYLLYLRNNVSIDSISNKYLLSKDRTRIDESVKNRFSLGDFEKIIGKRVIAKNIAVQSSGIGYDNKLNVRGDNHIMTFDETFIDFLSKEVFDPNSFIEIENEIYIYLSYITEIISFISKIRNSAAHRGIISKNDAEGLINSIFFTEKFFVKFMDKIKINDKD